MSHIDGLMCICSDARIVYSGQQQRVRPIAACHAAGPLKIKSSLG